MEMNFCRRCGQRLQQINNHVFRCANSHTIFANSSPSVGIFFVTHDNQVIFSERAIEPHKGALDSFGGFIDSEETAEAAVVRELLEELGLQPQDYETPVYITSAIGHYPYGGEIIPTLSMFYYSRLKEHASPKPADDVAAMHTVPLHEVELDLLHDDDIRAGVIALQKLFPQQKTV